MLKVSLSEVVLMATKHSQAKYWRCSHFAYMSKSRVTSSCTDPAYAYLGYKHRRAGRYVQCLMEHSQSLGKKEVYRSYLQIQNVY